MRILLQCEQGQRIGFGHFIRSRELRRLLAAQPWVEHARLVATNLDTPASLGNVGTPDVVVRDFRPGCFPPRLPNAGLCIDLVDEDHEASVDSDLAFAFLGHSDGPRLYAGLGYALLRHEFALAAAQSREDRRYILVSLGGTDPTCSTSKVTRALLESPLPLLPLFGPGAAVPTDMLEGVSPLPSPTPPMWGLLGSAAVAVTSCGATLLEAACMGVPTIAVAHNDREARRAERLLDSGAQWFRFLGYAEQVGEDAIDDAVSALLSDSDLRERMAAAGRAAVDGEGGQRVLARIEAAVHGLASHDAQPATSHVAAPKRSRNRRA